ncbi:alpha/beta hydrolase-fold protein [Chitinophaga sp. 22321]|uniref:Tetratricopeptide repeat protein n=1 Tax=Chitinophaga hostae TaxID=2831022 RepID=A0ABS5J3X8_9BACT|nr:alpha/beta hydrolase-fold protein [Chitinophaga hostae]MBS0029915.1 tetratricopeptide repeat protein [Chitinophaga hostae]
MKRTYIAVTIAVIVCFIIPSAFSQANDSIPPTHQSHVRIFSKVLQENRMLWISTPVGYNDSGEAYPVLYLLDGEVHFKYTDALVEYLVNRGRMPPVIIVGIVNTDRRRDFTPIHSLVINDKIDSSLATTGGGGKFLEFLQTELAPYIDHHYRTHPFRILAGASLGGLFAVYCKITAPSLFQASIIMSPAFYGGNNKILSDVTPFLQKNQDLKMRMFLALGDEKPDKIDSLLLQLKNAAGPELKWDFKSYPDEDHFSMPLKAMYDGLRFIYANWHVDFDQSTTISDYTSIVTHFKKLSTEFGYDIKPNEDFVNSCGYKQLELKNFDTALDIFRHNISNYPRSANVYDSMGEACLVKGDKEAAIRYYRKAVELDPYNEERRETLKKLENNVQK